MNELLWWFGQNTLAALLMIPCVTLACRLFRDRPAVQHLLWMVILLKFVTPPIVVWPWSVEELQSLAWTQTTGVQVAAVEPLPVIPGAKVFESYESTEEPLLVPITTMPNLESDTLPAVLPIVTEPIANAAQPRPSIHWGRVASYALISIWFAGATVCLASQLRRLIRFARLIHRGAVAPSHLKSEVTSVAALLRMNSPVSVVVQGFASPFLWCVGAARLAWPESISSHEDVKRSRGIIAHELAHLRRRDHWITWLELGASVLWWWNPLFWYVRRQVRETAEMSCDALAISADPESRHDYAKLLLQFSTQSRSAGVTPVLAMSSGSTRSFERRLRMVLSPNASGNGTWKGTLTMALLAAITLPHWSLAQPGRPDDKGPKPVAEELVAPEVQATPKNENAPRGEVSEPNQLDVRVVDAAADKPTSSVYLTLWRALSPDEPEPVNTDSGLTGFGYYNPVIWDDNANSTRWIRAGSAHPNDGQHGKSTEQFTFRSLQAGKYRITAVPYQPKERTPDPTPYGATKPIEVNGSAPAIVEIKLLSGDAHATVKLIDAETRLPISAAAIRLRDSHGMPIVHGHGSGNFFEWTDNDGTVQFRKLRPGSYSVEVLGKQAQVNSFVEYAPVEEWTSFIASTGNSTTEIAVAPRALSDDEIAIRFPFSVYGRVTDEQGRPLANVEIRAATGIGTLRGGGTVRSNADGNYRLYFGVGVMTQVSEDAPLGVGLQAAHFYADGGKRKVVGQKDGYYSLLMSDRTKEQLLDEIKTEGHVWGRKDTADVIFASQPRQLDFVVSEPTDSAPTAGNSLPANIETLLDWGTPVDGLRGAVMIQTSVQKPELTNRPKVFLVLQNVSDKPLRFCDTQMVKNDDVQVREDNRMLYLRDEEGILSGFSSSGGTDTDVRLQPREVVMIDLFYGEKVKENGLPISAAMVETIVYDPSLTYSVTINLVTAPTGAWSGKLTTPPSRGAALANGSLPKNAAAQQLFRYCIDHARLSGDIPGGTMSLLQAKVQYFIEVNTGDQSGDPYAKMMRPIFARLEKSGDWSQADVATLFDGIAAVTTIPLEATLEAIREHTLQRGMPLPSSLQNANWGAALAGGLRMAWTLEPAADHVHLGSSLKSRVVIYNSGKEPVAFVTRNFHQPTHSAQNSTGSAVKLESTFWTTIGRPEPYRLHPGEYCQVKAPGIGIGPRNSQVDDWANIRPGTWILADEGDEVQFQSGDVWLTGDHNSKVDADWWLKFVTERVDRESPVPASQDERKLILFRVVQDLFGTSPQTTEADAFYGDKSPEALHNLALLLSKRTWLTPVTGSIKSGPTKFKVLPADPNAATRPRIVTTPGRYNVGDELRLEVTRT